MIQLAIDPMKSVMGALAIQAAAMVGLCGCAHVEHLSGPHGEDIYRVACNGADSSLADCSTSASEACEGKGYRALGDREEQCSETDRSTGQQSVATCRSLTFVCGSTVDLATEPFVGSWDSSGSLDPACTEGSGATMELRGGIAIAPGGPGEIIVTGGTIGAGCVTHFAVVSGPVARIEPSSATCVARKGSTTGTTQFKKDTMTLGPDARTLTQEVDFVLRVVSLERGLSSSCQYRGAVAYTKR